MQDIQWEGTSQTWNTVELCFGNLIKLRIVVWFEIEYFKPNWIQPWTPFIYTWTQHNATNQCLFTSIVKAMEPMKATANTSRWWKEKKRKKDRRKQRKQERKSISEGARRQDERLRKGGRMVSQTTAAKSFRRAFKGSGKGNEREIHVISTFKIITKLLRCFLCI